MVIKLSDPYETLGQPKNEYWGPMPGPKFEHWPFDTIPFDIIMRVRTKQTKNQEILRKDNIIMLQRVM